jgi:hypothetical protein
MIYGIKQHIESLRAQSNQKERTREKETDICSRAYHFYLNQIKIQLLKRIFKLVIKPNQKLKSMIEIIWTRTA